eukprot:gene7937-6678_t
MPPLLSPLLPPRLPPPLPPPLCHPPPEEGIMGWGENDRGVSFTFGADVCEKFLRRHDFDLICRAH